MIKIEENISLAQMTTLGVGGIASRFVKVGKKEELLEALDFAKEEKLDFIVLGGGSNVLVSDQGYDGLVIINKANGFQVKGDTVTSESGVLLSLLSKKTLELGFLGLEFGVGIPGSVGAAVSGNVGMVLGCVADSLIEAEVWDDGAVKTMKGESLGFGYRNSVIKSSKVVVLSATFLLHSGNVEAVRVKVKEDLLRRSGSYRGRTAGSYFKNPEGVSAGELIDKAGLKGYRIGGAEISTDHANVFRNTGSATAKDFFELEKYVKKVILEKYGLNLVPEVIKIGEFS